MQAVSPFALLKRRLFTRNGGPYLYAKHALGDFWAFEVGVLKWIVTVIAWAAMAVGFTTALGAAVPALSGDFAKDVISFILIVGLTIVISLVLTYQNSLTT